MMTGKKIVLERKLDADLLAGLVVRIGDQVIDGSARARLSELASQLLSA
jgi:F-type H+-transporting ATPase subunit delta